MGVARNVFLLGAILGSCALAQTAVTNQQMRSIEAAPGTVVRWTENGTKRCAMRGKTWAAVGNTCYYPVDLMEKARTILVARIGTTTRQYARITVEPYDYGTEEIELPDIPQAHPSAEDLRRAAREQVLESKVFNAREGPPEFTLPLGPPARPFPPGKSFGVKRVYNGKESPQPHTGVDYPVPIGSPVIAVADGTVALTADLFYPGNAVFIDHGDGLVSEYFHLSEFNVTTGDKVKKGHVLGKIGSTGRATGPHLFFGVRWHGARIDPKFLFEDPARIPAIAARPSSGLRSSR
jgi:murein DD-endopeptidase MepM/ murein hydrolase activator NlpD